MVYTKEQLERMKRNLNITDDDYVEEENSVNEFPELSIYVCRDRVICRDDSTFAYHAINGDGSYATHQEDISHLVSSCLENFSPIAVYKNEVPEDADILHPYDDCSSLNETEFEQFTNLFNKLNGDFK